MEMELTDLTISNTPRRMGRPPLHMTATLVRFSEETLARIDALVGNKQRAKFIREAVEKKLDRMEAEAKD